jgi:hypothetical protein
MFTVVKNKDNAYYTVCKAWLSQIDEDEKLYTFYPNTKMKKHLEKGAQVKDNWKFEEVEVQLNDIEGMYKI